MRMTKTKVLPILFVLLFMAAPLIGFAQDKPQPEWIYPISPILLENKGGLLTLTNEQVLLPSDYEPNNLVALKLRSVSGPHSLRKEAALALVSLFSSAELDGLELYVKSSYRTYQTQSTMYANRLERYGKDDGVVAKPGSSDHQTGLGVDVLNKEWVNREGMTPAFAQTAEAQWLEANCARFGFIIRYLPEKQEITNIIYEPWHLRYVGVEVATYMMKNRLSLEEFTDEAAQAIAEFENRGGDFMELCRQLSAPPPIFLHNSAEDEDDGEVSFGSP